MKKLVEAYESIWTKLFLFYLASMSLGHAISAPKSRWQFAFLTFLGVIWWANDIHGIIQGYRDEAERAKRLRDELADKHIGQFVRDLEDQEMVSVPDPQGGEPMEVPRRVVDAWDHAVKTVPLHKRNGHVIPPAEPGIDIGLEEKDE